MVNYLSGGFMLPSVLFIETVSWLVRCDLLPRKTSAAFIPWTEPVGDTVEIGKLINSSLQANVAALACA